MKLLRQMARKLEGFRALPGGIWAALSPSRMRAGFMICSYSSEPVPATGTKAPERVRRPGPVGSTVGVILRRAKKGADAVGVQVCYFQRATKFYISKPTSKMNCFTTTFDSRLRLQVCPSCGQRDISFGFPIETLFVEQSALPLSTFVRVDMRSV